MKNFTDGAVSPLFKAIAFKGNTTIKELKRKSVSEKLKKLLAHAVEGKCVTWGIPFDIGSIALVKDKPVSIKLPAVKARWLAFLHTSDTVPPERGKQGLVKGVKRGHGQLNQHAADYVFCYADGTEERAKIVRRHHIGDVARVWGENCVEAVGMGKPLPVRAHHEQMTAAWGWSQTRASAGDWHAWMNWVWAWENPSPGKKISAIRLEPVEGAVLVLGIAAGQVSENPLRWGTRRKAVLRLARGVKFEPKLDERGLLKQIQLDLGQVISAEARLLYPNEKWSKGYNNQLPKVAKNEVLVEYAAHAEARFHLAGGKRIPVAKVQRGKGTAGLQMVTPATKKVKLKVVEKGSGVPVAVKAHLHGEWGEYLAARHLHRVPNTAWFEDYSPEFIHDGGAGVYHRCGYIPGEAVYDLPLGNVYLEVSKGFEIRPVRRVLNIKGGTDEVVIELARVLPWRAKGWVTADTHVHFLSPQTALLEGAAEGINVVNLLASQWGELMTNVGDFDGMTTFGSREAGGDGEYLVRVGTENRQHVMGHISLLGYKGKMITPMTTGGPDESAIGDPVGCLLTDWAVQCRKQKGIVVIPHFPNPRLEHAATIVSGNADAIEVSSWQDHYSGIDPYSLSDWYRYLNCGYQVAAVGGTDKMQATTAVGTVRTYALAGKGRAFSYESWKQAVRRGNTFVSYGPLLDFSVDGAPSGSRIKMGKGGGTVDVSWQAASVTVPMTRVELVVNGEIVESKEVGKWEAGGNWPVKIGKSSWLALLVRGKQVDRWEMIAAHSSAVMVEVQGSRFMAAADAVTILEQIEGALAFLDNIGTRAETKDYRRMRLVLTSAQRSLHNRMHQAGHFHKHPVGKDHHQE